MKSVALFLCIFLFKSGSGQFQEPQYVDYRQIPVAIIEELLAESSYCIDSTGKRNLDCAICYQSFSVQFFRAYYNKKEKKVILIGRTSFPQIGIYVGKSINSIPIDSPICITTGVDEKYWNFGFFQVDFAIGTGDFLTFYMPYFLAVRFNIGELLKVDWIN